MTKQEYLDYMECEIGIFLETHGFDRVIKYRTLCSINEFSYKHKIIDFDTYSVVLRELSEWY